MKLFKYEVQKVWANKVFLVCLIGVLAANFVLLWSSTNTGAYIPAQAYKNIAKDLEGMSLQQQQEFVEEKIGTTSALLAIDSFYQHSYGVAEPGPEMQEMLAEYGEMYAQGSYTLYTDNLRQEYRFLSEISSEIAAVSGYDDFLDGVQTQADTLSNISIFAQEDSYDMRTINATAHAYENIEGITIEYSPQKGFYTAVHFLFTDILLVFSILLLAGILVRSERDSGLLSLIRSTPKGRLATSFAKLAALAVSIFAVIFLLYGVNLVYCQLSFGLGTLSRSVQSLPFLMRCTMPISAGGYLLLFSLCKWAGVFVVGCVVFTFVLYAKKVFWGWCVALAFLGVNALARVLIPATSHWNVVKYANLISLLSTNELLGVYRNLYWFGKPIGLPVVVWGAAALFDLGFMAVFVGLFTKAVLMDVQSRRLVICFWPQKSTTIFREECHKVFVVGGAAILLILFGCFGVWQGITSQSYINSDEIYYRYYMQHLSGEYTKEKYVWLEEEYEAFEPITELQRQYAQGEISEAQYQLAMGQYYGLSQQKMVYDSILAQRVSYVANTKGTHFVYDTGYTILLDFKDKTDIRDTFLAGLLAALCFPAAFALEKQSGMLATIKVTPLGKRVTLKRKIQVVALVSGIITMLVSLPHYWQIARDYGFAGIFSPARSLPEYMALPTVLSLFAVIVISLTFKWLACLCMGFIAMGISIKAGGIIASIISSGILFCIMPLLSLLGIRHVKWLGFYLYFHVAQILTQPLGSIFAALLLLLAGFALFFCYNRFFSEMEEE